MEAVAHSAKFAKKVGIPRSVGEDFAKADKGKTFNKGGSMKMEKMVKPSSMSKDVEKALINMVNLANLKFKKAVILKVKI